MDSNLETTQSGGTLEDRIVHYSLPQLQEYVQNEFNSKSNTKKSIAQSDIKTIFKKKKKKRKIAKDEK